MRLSKKLLAALLPITATSALVPVLTSCNKGNGYDISYGDEVNCLDEKGNNYHSIDDVKNVVKNHASIEPLAKIRKTDLDKLQWSLDSVKQFMYYDLIASTAILNANKLHLTWNLSAESNKISLVWVDANGTRHSAGANEMLYVLDGTQINISLVNASPETYNIKSYNFQNTKVED